MVYPKCPDSYWSFNHALKFTSKKAAFPPLGLTTISAMLPKEWNRKLVDMNIEALNSADILWANFVFLSAMHVQKESAESVITFCISLNRRIVAGGPLFTQDYDLYQQVDYLILNEAEITLPLFIEHVKNNSLPPKHIYSTNQYADMTQSPIPDFHILSLNKYMTMGIQVSRGCPYSCDFCEVTTLLGHQVRMKNQYQVIQELETLYQLNWQGSVFIVDDNFIGKKNEVKTHLLPNLKTWMKFRKYPFTLGTQISIDFADDDELIKLMQEAGFEYVFIGIETINESSLLNCGKVQNSNRNTRENIFKIQQAGMKVSGGFIVGFDNDNATTFKDLISFIQHSGIVTAMVGLLNAPRNTKLYKRLSEEDRLIPNYTGNNTDFSMNFISKMDSTELINGYKGILKSIYSHRPYYQRLRYFFQNYKRSKNRKLQVDYSNLKGFVKCIYKLGFIKKGRWEFWKFLGWVITLHPSSIGDALMFCVYGFHFRKVYKIE